MPIQNKPGPGDGSLLNMAELKEAAMQGPHPKPGKVDLNRYREMTDKRKQFEAELLAAGRKDNDAFWEAKALVDIHMKNLDRDDPVNYGLPPRDPNKKKMWFPKL